jgi:hypothetical protein
MPGYTNAHSLSLHSLSSGEWAGVRVRPGQTTEAVTHQAAELIGQIADGMRGRDITAPFPRTTVEVTPKNPAA